MKEHLKDSAIGFNNPEERRLGAALFESAGCKPKMMSGYEKGYFFVLSQGNYSDTREFSNSSKFGFPNVLAFLEYLANKPKEIILQGIPFKAHKDKIEFNCPDTGNKVTIPWEEIVKLNKNQFRYTLVDYIRQTNATIPAERKGFYEGLGIDYGYTLDTQWVYDKDAKGEALRFKSIDALMDAWQSYKGEQSTRSIPFPYRGRAFFKPKDSNIKIGCKTFTQDDLQKILALNSPT